MLLDRISKRQQIGSFLVAIGMLIGIVTFCYLNDYKDITSVVKHVNGDIINFSEQTGVYTKTLTLKLKKNYELPRKACIYYTLDGNNPDENSMVYTEPIILKSVADTISVYPVKARLYYNGCFSDVVEHTFVLQKELSQDFSLNLISLTCDSDELYNPDNGIFSNISLMGEEGVRDAHLTMFQKNGSVSIEQDVGINIMGGMSRGMEIKSLKITADEVYDIDNPKLIFSYSDNQMVSECSFVKEYNSLRLKSGAQDMFQGNVRSAVVSRLAYESGFDGCTNTERAVLYLNGSFYGIYDIQQQYSNSFLANKFNLNITDAIEKHKGSEKSCFIDAGVMEYFMADLCDEDNKIKLEQNVDMDSYLLYNAIEILINNTDWPQNNYEIWRYVGESDKANPYTDGRWRFLIYDTDITYYSNENIQFFEGDANDTFVSLMEGQFRAKESVFPNVMRNEDFRNRFITIVCDLLNTVFESENVCNIILEEYGKIYHEMCLQYGVKQADEVASTYITWMKQQAEERSEEMHHNVNTYLGVDSTYDFSITTTKGISVSWGSMSLQEEENYSNEYYQNTSIEIRQNAYPGYTFSHWEVDGEKIFTDTLVISDKNASDKKVIINVVAKQIPDETIVISELSAGGDSDWIKIYNAGKSSVDLSHYYISDELTRLEKYQLPQILLKQGEYIVINGKNNYYALGEYICNFTLSKYDTLYLYNFSTNQIKDEVHVPRMEDNETYARYKNSSTFAFYKNNDGQRKNIGMK